VYFTDSIFVMLVSCQCVKKCHFEKKDSFENVSERQGDFLGSPLMVSSGKTQT
jgi:hypothetical protein